jgi:hypothetical protein
MIVYSSNLSIFLLRNNAGKLQNVLRAFSQQYFSVIWDEGTEPSLKARLITLLATYPGISSDYKLIPELTFSDESHVDIHLEPLHSPIHLIFQCKSVPIFWLDPLQFRENNLNSKSAKQQVAPKVAKISCGVYRGRPNTNYRLHEQI